MTKNQEFGQKLARIFYNSKVKTLPFILNEEQVNSFRKEWHILEYNTNTSVEHPVKDDDIVRTISKDIELSNKE